MTSIEERFCGSPKRVIILARTKTETSRCIDKLFPGITSNPNDDFEMHRNPGHVQRLQNFKKYRNQSSESSMSFESDGPPDYEDSDVGSTDGGARLGSSTDNFVSLHQDTPRSLKDHQPEFLQAQNQQMKRLKTGTSSFGEPHFNANISESSFSSYQSNLISKPSEEMIIYEIPWQTKTAKSITPLFVGKDSVHILVLNVDAISNSGGFPDDYMQQIHELKAYCNMWNTDTGNENATIETCARVIVGLLSNTDTSKVHDGQAVFTNAEQLFRGAIFGHMFEDSFEDIFILNNDDRVASLIRKLNLTLPTGSRTTSNHSPPSFLNMSMCLERARNDGYCCISKNAFVAAMNDGKTNLVEGEDMFLENKDRTNDIIYVRRDTDGMIWLKVETVIHAYISICKNHNSPTLIGSSLYQAVKDTCSVQGNENILNLIEAFEHIGFVAKINDQSTRGKQSKLKSVHTTTYAIPVNFKYGKDLFPNTAAVEHATSSVLRFAFKSHLPVYVFCAVIVECLRQGLKPATAGKDILLYKTTAAFNIHNSSQRMLLVKDDTSIFVVVIHYGKISEPVHLNEACISFRQIVSESIYKSYSIESPDETESVFGYQIRCTEEKGPPGEHGWIDVDELKGGTGEVYQCSNHLDMVHPHPVKKADLLGGWFQSQTTDEIMDTSQDTKSYFACSSKATPLPQTQNGHGNDELNETSLPKIAFAFGRYWDLFFAEQGIPQVEIDQIKHDNRAGQVEQVTAALQKWVKIQREKGLSTISHLRSQLRQCKTVNINWNIFDDAVPSTEIVYSRLV